MPPDPTIRLRRGSRAPTPARSYRSHRVAAHLFLLLACAVVPALAVHTGHEADLRHARERATRESMLQHAELASSELSQIVEHAEGY